MQDLQELRDQLALLATARDGRRIYPQEMRRAVIAAHNQSKMGYGAFAKIVGVNPSIVAKWKKNDRKTASLKSPPGFRRLAVCENSPAANRSTFTLKLNTTAAVVGLTIDDLASLIKRIGG